MAGTGGLAVRPSRRQCLQGIAGLGLSVGGLAVLAGCGGQATLSGPRSGAPRLEITSLRIGYSPAICFAAMYVAEDLFYSEGFSEVRYVRGGNPASSVVASGEADLAATDVGSLISGIDQGSPLTALSGLHGGCYELFGTDQVRAIRDLKGKVVDTPGLPTGRHLFLAAMLSYVGLNPNTDIDWATHPAAESIQRLADGQTEAFMAFPPEPQELRARQIGRLVVSTSLDRPWSDYFCCFVLANSDFVRKYPEATKRSLRAIIKANEICVNEPDRAARLLVDKGYTPRYDYALQTMKEIPYARWHEYAPEDSIRFYGLRLHEVGMIKSAPDKVISQGTNWRFINELKQELKA
jgi:NitT/TauT family transport system substrate-binding protein